MNTISLRALLVPAAVAGLLAVACTNVATKGQPASDPIAVPSPEATTPVDLPGLHNVVGYGPGLYSGSVPVGREGLETLAAIGVRTVISVDGATPDVATAEQLGLRYVHLPFSYDGVPAERRTELAQAISSCEGPIYVHCHHGKHRSATGLATALVTAGRLDVAEAEARMKVSGTSPNYAGLWQSVRECEALDAAALRVDPASFPSVATVSGLVASMSEIDLVFENVSFANGAGFRATAEHPDLVPANETRRLNALFTQLKADPESRRLPTDYQQKLDAAIAQTGQLDAAVRAGDLARARALYADTKAGCKACHKQYRDR